MAAQSNDVLYAERLGIPGKVSVQDLTDHANQSIDQKNDVDTTGRIVGDLLQWDGTNWVPINLVTLPLIQQLISGYTLREQFLGGSTSNAANQNFTVNINDTPFSIGDTINISLQFRGDFSGTGEFVELQIQGTTENIGDFASADTAVWQDSGVVMQAIIQDIGGGQKGFVITVDPTDSVNFTPGGMTNWWELRADITRA